MFYEIYYSTIKGVGWIEQLIMIQSGFQMQFKYLFVLCMWVHMCVREWTCHGMYVEVRGQAVSVLYQFQSHRIQSSLDIQQVRKIFRVLCYVNMDMPSQKCSPHDQWWCVVTDFILYSPAVCLNVWVCLWVYVWDGVGTTPWYTVFLHHVLWLFLGSECYHSSKVHSWNSNM